VKNTSNYGSIYELGRFLRKDWLRENNTRIHAEAFMPPEKIGSPSLEVSCFEVQNLNHTQILALADENIPPIVLNEKPPVGYGILLEEEFLKTALVLDFDDKLPRHVNIKGWEQFPEKQDKKLQAAILAEAASKRIAVR
jgi:hypothetical protein